eukprot:TRINITY_DN5112_c0_g1_i1.p1 TRINITY_DN5112_c0_g1~~TRINITY_DN5112_c0_g1_i1.p1  ORF type:complete len:627 (+),score=225.12 TRINITY_DN5112_c0_g1_i1:79-1881(+)
MANIKSLNDMKKDPPGGGRGGGRPPGFPGMPGPQMPAFNDPATVKHLSDGQLKSELKKAGSKLVVVDFTASWCGPCKSIAPRFAELSQKYTDVLFLKVDVDQCPNTASENNVRGVPTFHFYKNEQKVAEFSGADERQLVANIEKYRSGGGASSGSGGDFAGSGMTLGSGPATGSAANAGSRLLDRLGLGLGGSSSPPPTSSPSPAAAPSSAAAPTPAAPLAPASAPKPAAPAAQAEVNPVFLSNLVDMGISSAHAERALRATNSSSLEDAMDWCFSHEEEPAPRAATAPATASAPASSSASVPTPAPTPADAAPTPSSDAAPMEVDATSAAAEPPKPTEPTVHNALCNDCHTQIIGIRYKCSICSDFDLCQNCYPKRGHNANHTFTEHLLDIENPEKKPLTPEEFEMQKKKLNDKLAERRRQKAEDEKQRDIDREKNRIQSGKDAQEAKRKWEEAQRERDLAARRKEKEEDRLAKEAIKKKLEQDKAERLAAKQGQQQAQAAAVTAAPVAAAAAPAKKEYTESLIQLRFPDGNTIKATFKPLDPLRAVFDHVAMLLGSRKVSIMTTFPRREWRDADPSLDATTLAAADCVPTGAFIVKRL